MDDLHSLNEAINKRAGRKLLPSIFVSLTIFVLVFGLLAVKPILFVVLVLAALIMGLRELNGAYRAGGIVIPDWPLAVGAVVMTAAAWFGGVSGLAVATAFVIPNILVLLLILNPADFVKRSTAATFAMFYIPFLAGFIALIAKSDDPVGRILVLVVLVSCNDTFAYIFGVLFGKHYLAPHISPKKTWEGLIGSLIACTVGGALVFAFWTSQHWYLGALLGLMGVATSTFGDLIESAMKRDLHIKDMGAILPGHGGILDRIDSVLFTAPTVWFVLELIKHFKL